MSILKLIIISKIRALAIHTLVTFFTAALTWVLIAYWYAGDLAEQLRSFDIYKILMGAELVLGPMMSLVIYSPFKNKRELVKDYSLVLIIQLAALFYGLHMTANARPVFLVLARGQLEVVRAIDLSTKDLQEANDSYFLPSLFATTKSVCVNMPTDKKERGKLLTSILAGKDIYRLPKYFRKCAESEWFDAAKEMAQLEEKMKRQKLNTDILNTLYSKCKWLPFSAPEKVTTAIICNKENTVTSYINFDTVF
jgi:hypothetical protein